MLQLKSKHNQTIGNGTMCQNLNSKLQKAQHKTVPHGSCKNTFKYNE